MPTKPFAEIKFIGMLPQKGAPDVPVPLRLEAWEHPTKHGTHISLVLIIRDWRGEDNEVGWISGEYFHQRVTRVGTIENEVAEVFYKIDAVLLGVWFDSIMLGL